MVLLVLYLFSCFILLYLLIIVVYEHHVKRFALVVDFMITRDLGYIAICLRKPQERAVLKLLDLGSIGNKTGW